ncbi:hypothetical protein LOTGIDRAFT_122732 [Lottia gigantea]|uniref:Uncharacterized protein n=1 Tax=Lottia gigantea TaxID=225164 RepID=V4A294_LOTGI|nr:hypothetical protein LOTGIDRAFT_122732 [Lottia gigantea]ESO90807.1 hypothetical protein LOTGIDRAFT_122732 [Lottia gigantea]
MATGLPTYKVILCGEYGVGKSSIFRRFMNNTYVVSNEKKTTIGLDQASRIVNVNGTDVKLLLWDTGGMERMSFIGSSYYRGAQAALLCYSVNNKETFNILSQYILDIVMNAEGAKIFLCGNVMDCGDDKEKVTEADVDRFTEECDNVLSGVYKVSCRDNIGINEMFKDITEKLHEMSVNKMTLRRDMVIRPGETPELTKDTSKKRCC